MLTPFPPVPEDITRYILEAAAELDESTDLRMSRNLVLISKTVKAWIDPILHSVVLLHREPRMVTFGLGRTNFTESGAKSENIKRKVRRLGLLHTRCDPQITRRIFEVIEPTALHEIFINRTHFPALLSLHFPSRLEGILQPQRLITNYVDSSDLAEFPVGGLLARVTHLRLGLFRNTPQPSTLRKLSLSLPCLTHFAMSTFDLNEWGDEIPLLNWMLVEPGLPLLQMFVLEVVARRVGNMDVVAHSNLSIWEKIRQFEDLESFFTVVTGPPFGGGKIHDDYRNEVIFGLENIWERGRREQSARIQLGLKPYEFLPR